MDQRTPTATQLTMTPAPYIYFQARTPTWKLSPRNGGSTLYDSYELRAVTQQLNRTIQGSQSQHSPCPNHVKFIYPFRGCLDRVYKENSKTPKRLAGGKMVDATIGDTLRLPVKKRFIPRLWKKLKLALLSKKTSVFICTQAHQS